MQHFEWFSNNVIIIKVQKVVTRHVTFNWTKMNENRQNWKNAIFWVIFKQCAFVKDYFLLQILSANYSEMPFFNLGQVTRQPQINCSCYFNKAGKYFLINHELICWTLLHFFESHWCIFPLHFEQILSFLGCFHLRFIFAFSSFLR